MRPSQISRRVFLANASLATLAVSRKSLWAQTPVLPVRVRTPSGIVVGEKTNGVCIFRGVLFAEPPVKQLRFKPPVKISAWKGERDATRFAAAAMQAGEPKTPHSEDCLYLNIWAPEEEGHFPVYVWIHGGGFTGGHAFEPTFDGTQFAREKVVCITVAYRLGIFGFMDFESLLGPAYAGSANNALRDLITALEWIQENISAFGGDPSRVTIGGESAGAKLTGILMGIPSAQPLFHQMISESGGAERVWPNANANSIAKVFSEEWRRGTSNDSASLLSAPAEALIQTQQRFVEQWPQHFPLRPEIDRTLLSQLPVQTITAGSTRGKRLLIGTNRDESALFVGPHPSADATSADLGNLSQQNFAKVYQSYKNLYPELPVDGRRIRALTAEEYWIPSIRLADAHRRGGGSAWMYRLDFTESSGRLKGYAYHSLDIGLVWDKPKADIDTADAERALAQQMHSAWASFIRGDPPTATGLPSWPEYRTDTRATMILDTQSRFEQNPQSDELHLWDGLL